MSSLARVLLPCLAVLMLPACDAERRQAAYFEGCLYNASGRGETSVPADVIDACRRATNVKSEP